MGEGAAHRTSEREATIQSHTSQLLRRCRTNFLLHGIKSGAARRRRRLLSGGTHIPWVEVVVSLGSLRLLAGTHAEVR